MPEGVASEPAESKKLELDDVMLAMDVVDTLRHRERMVERELGTASREQELIERLRKIYRDQGIEVPDRILQDGVKALEERRFLYTPPTGGLQVRLAHLYVNRGRWWKKAALVFIVLVALAGVWFYKSRAPHRLMAELERLHETNLELAVGSGTTSKIEELFAAGEYGFEQDDEGAVRDARNALERMQSTLRVDYDVRVVARPGVSSGVWRVPEGTPQARNYYLIVEAVDARGERLAVRITSEEDQKTSTVKMWGLRVDEPTFNRVREDKLDDGIIQDRSVGKKARGRLEPEYTIETDGGTILRW